MTKYPTWNRIVVTSYKYLDYCKKHKLRLVRIATQRRFARGYTVIADKYVCNEYIYVLDEHGVMHTIIIEEELNETI